MSLLVLSRSDIARVHLSAHEVLHAVREACQALAVGSAQNPEKVKLTSGDTVSYAMLGAAGDAVGFKTSFTRDADPGRGGKQYFTTLSLYDETTGEPVALLDGARIGAIRTAAVTGLLAAAAAGPEASRLLLIGTGTQGRESLAPLLAAVPTLTSISLAGSHPEGLAAMKSRVAGLGVDCAVVDAADAAPHSDLIVAAAGPGTRQHASGEDLAAGAAVVLVGHGIGGGALWAADRVIATNAAQMAVTGTDLLEGNDALPTVDAELPEILAGRASGRTAPDQRVFAYNSGLVVTDIVLGSLIAERARLQGLGREVSLW